MFRINIQKSGRPSTFMEKILDHPIFLSFYGDDFTGSTDAMESLTLNGIPAALFIEPPTPQEIDEFRLKNPLDERSGSRIKAFGVAGVSRSLSPQEMDRELSPIFKKISRIPADFFHYKVCSTFDSSPSVGNIGHATDIAMQYFPSGIIPLIVGAPALNRFCLFGNLFARVGEVTYRLDRHPTMSKHPVTPMNESDLRIHLGQQSGRKVELFDIFSLEMPDAEQKKKIDAIDSRSGIFLLFDTLNQEHLLQTGKIVIENRGKNTQLLVGSSGTEYALANYLAEKGILNKPGFQAEAGRADQILIMAGSAAPTTHEQLDWCISLGFYPLRINTPRAVDPAGSAGEEKRVMEEALKVLNEGKSVAIFSALGPDDPEIARTKKIIENNRQGHQGTLASFQGSLLKRILEKKILKRVVVAGGDTSGYVSRALEIYALEVRIPVAPGAPLCTAHSKNPVFDGMEISLKGGQNGNRRYFESILEGKKLIP
ncbi:MAG: four-carbon acid sugar kinase family protein [Cyclobacteriaceae bacterium]|nr:four-carbon acid sugar kinase family protein [Cyclobacteriaceae bacterium]